MPLSRLSSNAPAVRVPPAFLARSTLLYRATGCGSSRRVTDFMLPMEASQIRLYARASLRRAFHACPTSFHLRVVMSAKLSPEALLSEYFGPFAVPAWKLLPSIEAATKKQTYAFMDLEAFNALVPKEPEQAQAIYWREMMLRIHLACCIASLPSQSSLMSRYTSSRTTSLGADQNIKIHYEPGEAPGLPGVSRAVRREAICCQDRAPCARSRLAEN